MNTIARRHVPHVRVAVTAAVVAVVAVTNDWNLLVLAVCLLVAVYPPRTR